MRVTALALAVVGSAVSAYLTWVHYSGQLALCLGAGGCETVQASQYAELAGAPVALLGLVAFVAATAVAALRLRADAPAWTLTALFGIGLGGTLFAAYLTYLELFIIHAICPWCVIADSAMVGVFAIALLELRPAPGA
jgi:uncharacterized membrane protein